MIKNQIKDLLKFNAEGVSPYDMLTSAKSACLLAVDEYTDKHGEPMYCGFANIVIHPARGRLVKFLKEMDIGSNGYGGGWRVSYYDLMPKGQIWTYTINGYQRRRLYGFRSCFEKIWY